jgi:hypothetical protein
MERESCTPRSQEPAIRSYPEPNESIWIKFLATFITELVNQTL